MCISLNQCIKDAGAANSLDDLALVHDKATGWHLAPFKDLNIASAEEICAEIDLLDPEADKVVNLVNELFHKAYPDVKGALDRERGVHKKALSVSLGLVSHHIGHGQITNQSLLMDVALKMVEQGGGDIFTSIQVFGITDEGKRYQIALKATRIFGRDISMYIQNFNIKNEEYLYQIALEAVREHGWGATAFIQNYGIKDEDILPPVSLDTDLGYNVPH